MLSVVMLNVVAQQARVLVHGNSILRDSRGTIQKSCSVAILLAKKVCSDKQPSLFWSISGEEKELVIGGRTESTESTESNKQDNQVEIL